MCCPNSYGLLPVDSDRTEKLLTLLFYREVGTSSPGSCRAVVIKTLRCCWDDNFIVFSCQLSDQWKNMSKALNGAGHSLVAVQDNLIDVVWTERPERPSTQLRTLGLEYTGQWGHPPLHTSVTTVAHRGFRLKWTILEVRVLVGHSWWFCDLPGLSWQDKVTALRAKMTERKVSWFVATALDEIACMLFPILSVTWKLI